MSHPIPVHCSSIVLYVVQPCGGKFQVLLLKRQGGHLDGQWSHLAGGIEAGEAAWHTAIREAQEEIGITLDNLYSTDVCEQYYRFRSNLVTLAPVFVTYVNSDAAITLNTEHSDYRWASIEEARELLSYPSQRQSLAHVENEFLLRKPSKISRIPLT